MYSLHCWNLPMWRVFFSSHGSHIPVPSVTPDTIVSKAKAVTPGVLRLAWTSPKLLKDVSKEEHYLDIYTLLYTFFYTD